VFNGHLERCDASAAALYPLLVTRAARAASAADNLELQLKRDATVRLSMGHGANSTSALAEAGSHRSATNDRFVAEAGFRDVWLERPQRVESVAERPL
jgi:hypothetical protein